MTALAGATWGISGPAFTALYVVVGVATGAAVVALRRVIRSVGVNGPADVPGDLAENPTNIAYLNKGATLAVDSALGALRVSGALGAEKPLRRPNALRRGAVTVTGAAPPGLGELTEAVHRATHRGVPRRGLHHDPDVRTVLTATRHRLTDADLFASPARWAAQCLLTLAVGAAVFTLGVVRHLAGTAAGHPVGNLDTLMTVVALGTIVAALVVPRQTTRGRRVLAELRRRNTKLRTTRRSSWAAYGPSSGALGVALFGTATLWAIDPTFSAALGVSRPGSSGGSGGGGGCGGGGGGGGCGG